MGPHGMTGDATGNERSNDHLLASDLDVASLGRPSARRLLGRGTHREMRETHFRIC